MDGRSRPLVFITTESGCMVCLTHRLNPDGYLRKQWSRGDVEMFHRFIYRAHNGDIPAGHEVDHSCRLRACCNPDHLVARPRAEHLDLTNRTRYATRTAEAKAWYRKHKGKGWQIAEKFGVSESTACRWIRECKAE